MVQYSSRKKVDSGLKLVVVNQAVNYLTVDICNAFYSQYEDIVLLTGGVRKHGEALHPNVEVVYINKWVAHPSWKKYLSYIIGTFLIWWKIIWKFRQYDIFFISNPPMGYLTALLLPNRISLLIWDVYPDTFKIIGWKDSNILYKIWGKLNKKVFKKAFKIYTVGERMADLLSQYISREKLTVIPLWSVFDQVEKVEKHDNPFIQKNNLDGKFIVQYSGSIGLTHRVEFIVEIAEKMISYPNILFQIIGRGSRKSVLERIVKEKKLSNCQFLPFQPEEEFINSLSAADLGVVILDSLTEKGSIPSKTYNLIRNGIPVLCIASGDSELFYYCEEYEIGKCFDGDNLDEVTNFIIQLFENKSMHEYYSSRALTASEKFTRKNALEIAKKFQTV